MLLDLQQVGSLFALDQALGRVEDLALDHKGGLPGLHAVVLVDEVRRRRPHPVNVLELVLHVHDDLLLQPHLVLLHALQVELDDLGLHLGAVAQICALLLFKPAELVEDFFGLVKLVVFLKRELDGALLAHLLHLNQHAHSQTA